jgi:hypothetical protein
VIVNELTNSESIYNDANFNNTFYKKINNNYLIDYSTVNSIKQGNDFILMINLAR